jgi:BASS family bile acid:Na+ symporter
MKAPAFSLQSLLRVYGRALSLILMMALGALLPQFHVLSPAIQYLLMGMLFFAYLDIRIDPHALHRNVLWVLLANLGVAFLAYGLLVRVDTTLALAAFITGIAPTAISSSVIVSFIQGRVEYVASAVLLTNVSVALLLPIALPVVAGAALHVSTWQVLRPVLVVMLVPLILARLARRLPTGAQTVVVRGKPLAFLLWLVNLFIVSSNASHFLRTETAGSLASLLWIALISLVICAVNFSLGALIGGRLFWQEFSQALGQKNNSFAIWIALTFLNPLIAIGPTSYVLYHNLYNSFQIYLFEKRRRDA